MTLATVTNLRSHDQDQSAILKFDFRQVTCVLSAVKFLGFLGPLDTFQDGFPHGYVLSSVLGFIGLLYYVFLSFYMVPMG